MKLLIMQFSPTSCLFIPLWFKYSPQHPVLKHHMQNYSFVYSNFYVFYTADERTKGSGLNDKKHYRISSNISNEALSMRCIVEGT
jgi:hypothetical protein